MHAKLAQRFTVIARIYWATGDPTNACRLFGCGFTPTACGTSSRAPDIERVTIVGHSLGGGVTMSSYRFPQLVDRRSGR